MNQIITILWAVLAVTSGVYIYTNTNNLDNKIELQQKEVAILQDSVGKSIANLAISTNKLATNIVAIQKEKTTLSTLTQDLSGKQTRLDSLLTLRKLNKEALAE
jgi:K+/H+ antiporter YhaU regulatory subunit KhtT